MERVRKMFDEFKSVFTSEDVLKENESHANVVVATVMIDLFLVILVSLFLNLFGIIEQGSINTPSFVLFSSIVLGIPATLCFIFKGEKNWFKYLLLLAFILVLSSVAKNLTYITALLMVIPVILSARYYSQYYTIKISIITVISFVISAFISGVDCFTNYQELITTVLLYHVIVVACVQIARSGKNMIERQQEISKKGARIETELNLANEIQKNMLPSIFPPFPEHEEIDIYAKMIPAKEVGGDFYDMFLLDENHLAITIADVSGKGVPGALFMMRAKNTIRSYAEKGTSIEFIMAKANNALCKDNPAEMFVTAWIGIINLETGIMECANF